MTENYIDLSYSQVLTASILFLLNAVFSLFFHLKLEKTLIIAAVRMTLQLSLVGLILRWVFAQENVYLVLFLATIMTLIAAQTAVTRPKRKFKGIYFNSIISIFFCTWITAAFMIFIVNTPEPWYLPHYVIPILGMILGNSLNGIALGLDRLLENLLLTKSEIELYLSLGASRWEAARQTVTEAIRSGLIPITNSMLIAGLVSLPGMMTGQILAGVDPADAVKYQIVIMFLIAASTGIGTISVIMMSYFRLFNEYHQFNAGIIKKK